MPGRAVENHDILPPDLPVDYIYTRYYCEENVYLLCREFLGRKEVCERWDVWVVFISNENKTVALWGQKAARQEGAPVIWDYHVVLVLRAKSSGTTAVSPNATSQGEAENIRHQNGKVDAGSDEVGNWVYDFDTSIAPMPCRWGEYLRGTFPHFELPPQYQSLFRLVPGQFFIDHFASDRSHMLRWSGVVSGELPIYITPPPTYDPICGEISRRAGVINNLMSSFVCMDMAAESTYGNVVSLEEVIFQLKA